jgi:hypothetical protein
VPYNQGFMPPYAGKGYPGYGQYPGTITMNVDPNVLVYWLQSVLQQLVVQMNVAMQQGSLYGGGYASPAQSWMPWYGDYSKPSPPPPLHPQQMPNVGQMMQPPAPPKLFDPYDDINKSMGPAGY